jgi:hypothetical protein
LNPLWQWKKHFSEKRILGDLGSLDWEESKAMASVKSPSALSRALIPSDNPVSGEDYRYSASKSAFFLPVIWKVVLG